MQIHTSFTILAHPTFHSLLADLPRRPVRGMIRLLATAALTSLFTACGGGGTTASSTPTTPTPMPPAVSYTVGVYAASSGLAAQCAVPRTGTDSSTGLPYPDQQGSIASENNFLRSWTYETYLWFSEVPDLDPRSTPTTAAYFDLQKTSALLASGQAKDRFHFTYDTATYNALSQSGLSPSYGIYWVVLSAQPPRQVLVGYTDPGSPATAASPALARGALLLGVDGVDVVNDNTTTGVATINAALTPSSVGIPHSFTFQDRGTTTSRVVSLTSANVTSTPVQNAHVIATGTGTVGYLLFNDHIATAEQGLVDAITTLKAAHVSDLVIDIRYNGGGYLDIASELAYMIAGSAQTSGKTFELLQFNSKHPTTDAVTGATITPEGFLATTQGFGQLPTGQALPQLNLGRVFVLTSSATCSASESIINSLSGIGVTVIQIGGTTCGKPYGFYPQDNCGTTYFSLQFQGVNNVGFGDYPEGFSATRTTGAAQANLPGCGTADDLTHDLGDASEGQLAAALSYQATGACPAAVGEAAPTRAQVAELLRPAGPAVLAPRTPLRDNRILR